MKKFIYLTLMFVILNISILYACDEGDMHSTGMMGNNMMGNFGMGSWGWGIGGSLNLIIWILIIVGIVWLISWLIKKPFQSESSLEILKRRYAKGEISKKEFNEMKKEIS